MLRGGARGARHDLGLNMNPLYRTTLSKLVFFQVLIAVLLFLPAWTLHFWQAWLFWIVFTAAQATISLYFLRTDPHLIENRLKAGPGAESRPAQKLILSFAVLLSLSMIVLPALDHRFGWSSVPAGLVLMGDLGVFAGMSITFFVFRANTHAAATVRVEQNQQVISTGLYGLVRHPMYLGALILFIAAPLALGSYWTLLLVPPLFAVLAARLLDEERLLVANLPGYAAYCEKVRYHLLPFVW
jgi:protein-S-isoprenylcysteine O-methyltransferase Ste14